MKVLKLIIGICLGLSITAFSQSTKIDLAHQVQGTLPVGNGGLGASTIPGSYQLLCANSAGTAYLPCTGIFSNPSNGLGISGDISATSVNICADSSGSGVVQSCNTSTTFTPTVGSCVTYTTTTTNSGAGLTVNVNSFGAKNVAIPSPSGWSTTLTPSIIPANKPQLLCYDGSNFNDVQTGTISAGGAPPTFIYVPNAASVGTVINESACWSQISYAQQYAQVCPISYGQGLDHNLPFIGVCVSGCGTTGTAKIQISGEVSWICDNSVTSISAGGYWVQPSSTTNGYCHQPGGAYPPAPNENPEGNTVVGFPDTGNAGIGTAALINLSTAPYYQQQGLLSSIGGGSPFYSITYWYQNPSTDAIPYSLTGTGFHIQQQASHNQYTMVGQSTSGSTGVDTLFDSLSHGFTSNGGSMFRFNGAQYQVPQIQTINGAASAGTNGYFFMCSSTGMYIFTLAGNSSLNTVSCDNPGHISTFDIIQASSGGPYTFTWPANFLNAPAISTIAGKSTVVSFLYDGTNYLALPNTASFNTLTSAGSITSGANGGASGSIVLNGSSSGSATISASSSGVLTLPLGSTVSSTNGNVSLKIGSPSFNPISTSLIYAGSSDTTSTGEVLENTAGYNSELDLIGGTSITYTLKLGTSGLNGTDPQTSGDNAYIYNTGLPLIIGTNSTNSVQLNPGGNLILDNNGTTPSGTLTLNGGVAGSSGDSNHSTTVTISSATSVGSTSLCSNTNCPAGTYQVNAYLDVTTACGSTGTYYVSLIYTDDVGSKTIVMPLEGTGTTTSFGPSAMTSSTSLASTNNFAQGVFQLRSSGSTSINYSTTASACGSGGPAAGKLYLSVTRKS